MSRISDLLLRRGDIEAQRHVNRGQRWGGTISALAGLPAEFGRMRAADAEARQAGIDRDLSRTRTVADIENINSQMVERQRTGERRDAEQMDQAATRDLAQTTAAVQDWLTGVASRQTLPEKQAAYQEGRTQLVGAGRLQETDAPAMWPGDSWVKSRLTMLLPAAERFKALFPEAPAPESGFTLGPGQQRFGPGGGPPIASVPAPAPASPAPAGFTLGPGQQRYDAQGNEIASRPATAPQPDVVQVMGPNGVPIWVRRADAIGKPAAQAARAVTGQERGVLAFYNRAKDAVDTITESINGGDSLEQQIAKAGLMAQGRLQIAPNWMQSQENQAYRQAQRAFTEARLRKESGAAIPTPEYENDAKTYFAQPGDDEKIIEQKRAARQVVLDGLKFSAGKAYEEYYGEPNVSPRRTGPPGGGNAESGGGAFSVTAPNGTTYTFQTQGELNAFKAKAGIR